MGGCATKPKANAGEVPPPEQEPEPEPEKFAPRAAADVNEAVVVLDKAKEIVVEDDAVDEHGNRRRSLSNLFKENNEAMESTKLDKPTLDPVKQEEPSADQKFAEVSEALPHVNHESGKIETPVERTVKEVEAPVETNEEKAIEAASTAGTLTDHEAIKSTAPALVEMQKHEETKTLVEEKSAVETQKPETPKEEKLDVLTHQTPEEQKAVVEATMLIENPQIPQEKTTNE
ncbi:uncharacterized protein LOC127798809 [Diospyros lotus]|uniref:uncharacterized protein LOC127798809 n=1 Tax=Diospyros lotus TaxID=55363 RepID=UPI0022585831|nr:uncharacterized protein LOC127798809 [Diospyros lotus]